MFDGRRLDRGREQSLLAIASRHGSRAHIQRTENAIIAQAGLRPQMASPTLTAASARLDNRAELAVELGLDSLADDAAVIRRLLALRGERGVRGLLGAFAFAHWNEAAQTLILGRDYVGYRSLFFHAGQGFVAFATLLADLLAIADVPRQLDERAMAQFIALDLRQPDLTPYRHIRRAPTRSLASIGAGGVAIHRYWEPSPTSAPTYKRDEDYVDRARELFDRAVERCIRDLPRVAVSASGGLDSSAIAATVSRMRGAVATYTCVPPTDFRVREYANRYADERPKIEALQRMHPAISPRYLTPRGPDAVQRDGRYLFAAFPVPLRGVPNWNMGTAISDAITEDGHRVGLYGNMGNIGLSWSGQFSLPALAGELRLRELLADARAIAAKRGQSLLRVLDSELVMRVLPRGVQHLRSRLTGKNPYDISRISLLNPSAIEEFNLEETWIENGFDPQYRSFGDSVALRAHYMFDQNQLTRDFTGMRFETTGYEARDPHADRELLEFCLNVPERLFRKNAIERSFARRVFADRLPPEILDERRLGLQLPNWFESLDARRDIFAEETERLETSPLARRLLDIPRMKSLIESWPKDADEAENRREEYHLALDRAVHAGQFIRWVEGGNG